MMYIRDGDCRCRGCFSEVRRQKSFELDARVYIYVNKHGGEQRHHGFVEDGRSVRHCAWGAGTRQRYDAHT